MPTPACEPLRPTDRPFPRPVLPDRPFDKTSKFRSAHTKTAAKALATLGVKLMPTHGIVWTGKGYECDCMAWARKLAKKTGAPVQPCAQPGKRPRLRGWPDAATSDPSQLDAWTDPTRGGKPTSNFSAVTGPKSRVWIVDIDGDQGFVSLDALQASIGELPQTWTTISGSGKGAHLWWRLPEGCDIRSTANALAPKIDVRGYNGQIVVPGSRHHSGNQYCWAAGCAPDETPLIEAPEALVRLALDACKKTRASAPSTAPTPRKGANANRSKGPPQRRVRPASVFGLIGDGEGRLGFHDPINRAACAFFRHFGPYAEPEPLKAALTTAISKAPTENREPGYVARYLDPERLDEAIQSARVFITGEMQ